MPRKKPDSPKPAAKKKAAPVPVDAIKHKDTRPNIPTRELAAFAADDEQTPRSALYPRDPSLDPQLVWKGKDEQDAKPLEVPAVPIYIQEKVHPQALVEDLRARAAAGKPRQAELFADFNGMDDDFARKVDFYHHDQHWTNRLILGDSLLVMTSLAEKERLKGRVQMVYFDPPYGIKFGSNWQVSTRKRDVKDAKADDLTRQPEQIKAFRDTWQLGIHSYLTYLRDRFTVARELLTESGSIFVQIGDENVHLVRSLLDEVFGSENCCSNIIFRKTTGKGSQLLDNTYDVVLWYSREIEQVRYRALYEERITEEDQNAPFIELPDGSRRQMTRAEESGQTPLPAGSRVFRANPITNQRPPQGGDVREFFFEGKRFTPGAGTFRSDLAGMSRLMAARRLIGLGNTLRFVRFADDFPYRPRNDIWDDTRQSGFGDPKIYVVQTTPKVIERCLLMTTDPGDLVLDPTCGSGTTACVAEQWGRRWVTIDTSRVALALARTRLMAARYPYYLLADSPAGRRKDAELASGGRQPPEDAPGSDTSLRGLTPPARPDEGDIRRGFVYKRVPHVTLKSIANNPDIREGMTRAQIDAAIRKHAETETLYDQPYEDKDVVRVTGPFTVESLSPHRVLPAGDDEGEAEAHGKPSVGLGAAGGDNYIPTILDNLRKAGVQNTVKNERLTFDRLDAYPGQYVHAEGEYTESGTAQAVRVSVGPEFGTVGPEWIKEAALEAIKGARCELLLVCGFAFDPHVSEQTQELKKELRLGKLRVLPVRMNPDLAMGDELLKKTGAGNLFLIFGEPDVALEKQKDGRLTVEVRGVDVYDPTTGQVRSHSTADVACWFVDTDYDGESFFVRHAYFCGGDEPFDRLKRALRAEVDEAEWAKLYATRSVPFAAPAKGKIAVKVINHYNHYGDEVLKVYKVP